MEIYRWILRLKFSFLNWICSKNYQQLLSSQVKTAPKLLSSHSRLLHRTVFQNSQCRWRHQINLSNFAKLNENFSSLIVLLAQTQATHSPQSRFSHLLIPQPNNLTSSITVQEIFCLPHSPVLLTTTNSNSNSCSNILRANLSYCCLLDFAVTVVVYQGPTAIFCPSMWQ